MNKRISYNSEFLDSRFEKEIRSNKYIPYRVLPREKYKRGSMYYINFEDLYLKILDVKYKNNIIEFVYAKTIDNNFYQYLVSDLTINDYRIEKDSKFIYKRNIINDGHQYTGAEIIYWFFINDIDCFNEKYAGFWKFVDSYSAHRIADNNKYIIKADIDNNGNYYNCIIARQNPRTRHKKSYNSYTNEFMKNQKEYDYHRIKDFHENRFNEVMKIEDL